MVRRSWVACLFGLWAAFAGATGALSQPYGYGRYSYGQQSYDANPWAGLYVGLHGGYAWNNDNDSTISGAAFGLHLGYNLQLYRSFVVGIEGDYSATWAAERAWVPGATIAYVNDYLWSVRARLGWTPVDNVLIYGTVGVGGFNVDVTGTLAPGFVPHFTHSASYVGVVYGGGAEVMVTSEWLVRAEAMIYDGGSTQMGVLRAGISYKF